MSIQHKLHSFAIIVTVISGGCTVVDKFPNHANTTIAPVSNGEASPMGQLAAMHDSSDVDIAWVFQYYRLISTVPTKILIDEYERTKKDFSAEKTTWNQWQLAMLLSLPSTPFYDPARSSVLFKELTNTSADQGPVINDAAFLMYSLVKEQHQTNKRAVDLEGQLAESRSANKTLQEQLEALKAIEENLSQRNKVEAAPKP